MIASHITAGLILASPFILIAAKQWRGLLIIIIGLSQVLIATWFHPFAKHYQQAYPLIILTLAAALMINRPAWRRPEARLGSLFAHTSIFLLFTLVAFMLFQPSRIRVYIDDHNHQTALDSVVYRALQSAKKLPGPVGVDQAYLPARLYFGDQAYYYGEEISDPTKEMQWLSSTPIKTMIITNLNPTFMSPPADWQLVSHHKSEGKEERLFESFVYTLPDR